jgi:hypothetical protein
MQAYLAIRHGQAGESSCGFNTMEYFDLTPAIRSFQSVRFALSCFRVIYSFPFLSFRG